MKFIARWLSTALAVGITAWLLPGITVAQPDGWLAVLVIAALLGLVNAIVRPIVTVFSLPFIVLTAGLFFLVINAGMLALSSWIAVNWFHQGVYIDGFWTALLGSLIISIIASALSHIFRDGESDHPRVRFDTGSNRRATY